MFPLLKIWAAWPYMLLSVIWCKNEPLKNLHFKSIIKCVKEVKIQVTRFTILTVDDGENRGGRVLDLCSRRERRHDICTVTWNDIITWQFTGWHANLKVPYFLNPILTGGGGGGVNLTPPAQNLRLPRDTPFHYSFLSSLTHLLIPSLRKSDHRSRGHVTFCTRTSAQNLPKIRSLHMFVYKTHGNYWFS